ncbi:MAG: DUF1501 domain-containing protein, partial [Planctomycetota bacterium]
FSQSRGRGLTRPTLVGVFLRGAIDGLSVVVPYGDADLYSHRPTLAVQPPGMTDGALDLDGFFGLNPNAGGILTPYQAGRLALVHACGSTDPTRSHFDAMRSMETGQPDDPSGGVTSGWLARHLQSVSPAGTGPLRAVALDSLLPRVLAEAPSTLPIPDPGNFAFPGNPATASARESAIQAAYARTIPPLAPAAQASIDSIGLLNGIDFVGYVPANGAVYPASEFGQVMRNTAALIKADIGLEVAHHDYGGWDHHNNQGPITGTLANMLADLSASLEAFYLDMQGMEDRYVLYAKSEFGRRVAENGSAGTDHGSGGIMMVMGKGVQGGQVHGTWPTLDAAALDEGDVRVETDYRDVVAEILMNGLGGTDLGHVFEGHMASPLGVVL